MRARLLVGLLLAGSAVGLSALAQGTAPEIRPYLSDPLQSVRLLPPPPAAGSGRQADDEAAFTRTRALQGQPRWSLATRDADLTQGIDLFDCALGQPLGAADLPTLKILFARVQKDARAVIDPPKDHYQRPRPYLASNGPICMPKDDALAKSASYPSGHSTLSWAWGLILAELAPDRATDILMRARAIGESRVVCGVHYPSDIEAGRTNGAALVAALHGDPAFRADLEKARAELAAARTTPHVGAEDCQATDDAAAHTPY